MNLLKGLFHILQDNLVQGRQKLGIFNFQSQFLRPKLNLNFTKAIFLLEYQIRTTTFINIIFNLIHFWKNIFSKNVPNFRRLCTKFSCKISKNPLRRFIWIQKSIEFQLPHCKIPQPCSYYCLHTVSKCESFKCSEWYQDQSCKRVCKGDLVSNPHVIVWTNA